MSSVVSYFCYNKYMDDILPTPSEAAGFNASEARANFEADINKQTLAKAPQEPNPKSLKESLDTHEVANSEYKIILEDMRRTLRQFDLSGVFSKNGEFIGLDLLAPTRDKEGFVSGREHTFIPNDEDDLVFPNGFALRFRDEEGKEIIYDSREIDMELSGIFTDVNFYEQYSQVLQELESTSKLTHMPDQNKEKLVTRLDQQRRDIHNQAAEEVKSFFSEERSFKPSQDEPRVRIAPVGLSHENAKLLFELSAKINEASGTDATISSGYQLSPEALEGLRIKVREETGFDSLITRSVHFHGDDEAGWVTYGLKLLGAGKNGGLEIGELVQTYIRDLRRSAPDSLYPKTRN